MKQSDYGALLLRLSLGVMYIVLSAVQALLGDGAYALKLPGHAEPATPRSFAGKHA